VSELLEFNVKKIESYLKELKKLGIILDLEDIMYIDCEDSEEISFCVDGEILIKKDKIKGGE